MDTEELRINKEIGERVFIFRKSKRLSRVQLAEMLHVTQQQLDKYEKGVNRISAAKLSMISQRFGIDITYFYSDLLSDADIKSGKDVKESVNSLLSYYLNIKKPDIKHIILTLTKELAENQ